MRLTPLAFAVLTILFLSSCQKAEEWSAIIHSSQTSVNHRTAGVYPTVQECLSEGKKQKGNGYLECGLNCRWDAQGLFNCEKTVVLMERPEEQPAPKVEPQSQQPPASTK